MNAADLVEALKKTGTGEQKLKACQDFLERNPRASAEALVNHLGNTLVDSFNRPLHPGTYDKARRIAAGESPAKFDDGPPKQGTEGREKRLVEEIFAKLQERDRGIPVEAAAQAPLLLPQIKEHQGKGK